MKKLEKIDLFSLGSSAPKDSDRRALAMMKELERKYAARMETTRVDEKTVICKLKK